MEHHSDLILLIDAAARLHGRLRSAFMDADTGNDLGEMGTTVLAAVAEARHPPTVPQIGRSLGHPRQVIQRAANALMTAGLIETAPNPDHKRAALLVPTAAGKARQAAANARAARIAQTLLESIDPADVREATRLLESIRAGLEEHSKVMAR